MRVLNHASIVQGVVAWKRIITFVKLHRFHKILENISIFTLLKDNVFGFYYYCCPSKSPKIYNTPLTLCQHPVHPQKFQERGRC